jgi:PKD domain
LNYRAVVFFSGSNTTSWATAHIGGSFPLQDYLVAGGKAVFTGQDLNSQIVYNQNTGSDFLYATMGGWLTGATRTPACAITASDRDFYGTGTANPTTAVLETSFTLLGKTGDVSTNLGGTGAGNQRFPDAGRTLRASDLTDTCVLANNGPQVEAHARVLGTYTTTKKNGTDVTRLTSAVATGVAPDPTLGRLTPRVSWTAAYLHVGLEGLNANRAQLNVQTALGLVHDFVSDSVSVTLKGNSKPSGVTLVAQASSASGAAITKYRWNFGDGSPIVETTAPTVVHDYAEGTYTAQVEAVNALTRTNVASTSVHVNG